MAVRQDLRQSQHVLQLAAEDEIVVSKYLLGARLVQMREEYLRPGHGDSARPRERRHQRSGGTGVNFTLDRGALGTQVEDLDIVDERLACQCFALKCGRQY